MNKYKPEYLGKVIPAEDTVKMTDMLQNKFEQFSNIYDTLKDMSTDINDIKLVDTSSDLLSVKISTDMGTITELQKKAAETGVNINGDIVTAKKSS